MVFKLYDRIWFSQSKRAQTNLISFFSHVLQRKLLNQIIYVLLWWGGGGGKRNHPTDIIQEF